MTIEITVLISLVSATVATASAIISMRRNSTTDAKKESADLTTVIVKLENIANDTTEIKTDIRGVKDDLKQHSEQIIRIDQSLKAAWKVLDRLQGGRNEQDG